MAAVTYKCPNCGGGLVFDPESQKFRCEFCISLFTEEELAKMAAAEAAKNAKEEKPEEFAEQSEKTEQNDEFSAHTVVYSCPSCGAEVVCDDTTAATFCYYCHNPVVLAGRLKGELTPDKVIPFTFTHEEAERKFLEWANKKKFVPHAFFSKKQIEKLSGVYFPYWYTNYDIHGTLDVNATKVRIWKAGDTEYTETKYYRVRREGDAHFDDVSRPALKKANEKLVQGVQPFDTSKMLDFSMSYLSGFQAEKRDIDRAAVESDVTEEVCRYTKDFLRDSINEYTTVTGDSSEMQVKNAKWNYALLPVWVLTYCSGGKTYYYAMNGQTGRVCGKLPIDWKRLAMLGLGVAAPLFGLLLLGGYLL